MYKDELEETVGNLVNDWKDSLDKIKNEPKNLSNLQNTFNEILGSFKSEYGLLDDSSDSEKEISLIRGILTDATDEITGQIEEFIMDKAKLDDFEKAMNTLEEFYIDFLSLKELSYDDAKVKAICLRIEAFLDKIDESGDYKDIMLKAYEYAQELKDYNIGQEVNEDIINLIGKVNEINIEGFQTELADFIELFREVLGEDKGDPERDLTQIIDGGDIEDT